MSPKLDFRVIERGWLSSNNILFFAGQSAVLVDSGYVGHATRTVELVREALAGRRLTQLINTHSHSDHIGGNSSVQQAFDCRIVIPAGIETHVANWDQDALLLGPAAQRGERFRHDQVIAAGESFEMGGLAWDAIAAPGHDMEALVFHCPERGLLISGDALWQDGFGIVFGELMGRPGALAATRGTLEMLSRLSVTTVLPGHGKPFDDVEAALQRAFRRLAAFEEDPGRMARNALRACFTFNLLDLGRLPKSKLATYLQSVPLFRDVGSSLLGLDAEALADWLLAELLRAQAVILVGGDIVPTMAA
jgi:glyoxylase-like metal-dependent hydrolase (beta-lactamase superfamily II)